MPVITAVKHYVRRQVLETWLTSTFGGAETGTWSIEEIASGTAGTWQVTAPAAITESQQVELANKSQPRRARTFGR